MNFKEYLLVEKIGWENLPKGWTRKSLTKFARSLTGKTKMYKALEEYNDGILFIGPELYYMIEKNFKDKIENWED